MPMKYEPNEFPCSCITNTVYAYNGFTESTWTQTITSEPLYDGKHVCTVTMLVSAVCITVLKDHVVVSSHVYPAATKLKQFKKFKKCCMY